LKNDQLPKDWKWVKLGDVCNKISNGTNAKQSEDKIGYPISRIETIWNETIDLNRVKYIEENNDAFVQKYKLQEGDILFSHINSDIHLGKTAIFKNQSKVLIHGINLLLIRFKDDALADFFNYQFKYKRKRGEFISIAQKSVNQSSINQPKLKSIDFALPPKPTQQAIVSKIEELFSELDKGIENLHTAQQQLKTYRQSVLKWAFEGKLTNSLNYDLPDRQAGSYDLHDEHDLNIAAEPEIKYSKKNNQDNQNNQINHSSDKGELPKGWKWVKLDLGLC
jgi:type I restriction enzyme S subunit